MPLNFVLAESWWLGKDSKEMNQTTGKLINLVIEPSVRMRSYNLQCKHYAVRFMKRSRLNQ